MVVTHNIEANFTGRQIGIKNKALNKNTEKLSSGYRVNRAADDASGLAISEGMRGQVRGLSRSALNTDEGTSFCQIADGAMQEMENIIHRMRELSVQAADDVNTPQDREMIQYEIDQLVIEINRITDNTEYNTMKVFAGDPENRVGKDYGLSKVLGTGNVYQGQYMDSPVPQPLGAGWNSTGQMSNGIYGSWIDFKGLGSTYSLTSLEGQGFTTGCRHCQEDKLYAVEFTLSDCQKTNADGVNYSFTSPAGYHDPGIYNLTVNISGCKTGEEIIERIMSAAKSEPGDSSSRKNGFIDHYIQFAYNSNDPTKLYMYDKDSGIKDSTFKPAVEKENGQVVNPPRDLNIQVGSNAGQFVTIESPNLNAIALGVAGVNLTTQESAGYAITACDTAIDILNRERAYMGSMVVRLSHAYDNVKNEGENIQSSESLIRDLDMADEMVKHSANNIILQAAQSMLSQANSSKDGVLALVRE